MRTYRVKVREVLWHEYQIDADSPTEAEDLLIEDNTRGVEVSEESIEWSVIDTEDIGEAEASAHTEKGGSDGA